MYTIFFTKQRNKLLGEKSKYAECRKRYDRIGHFRVPALVKVTEKNFEKQE
jgi:hypothetical protein